MTKGRLFGIVLISCFIVLAGCIKNQPYVTTINPYLTASIGTYTFTAANIVPSTLDTQIHDSVTELIITGFTADQTSHNDKIILLITKYKAVTGTYSIVQRQAGAYYIHSGVNDTALGGIVAITHVNSNSLTGYFNFTTQNGNTVSNGTFNVGLP